MTKPKPKLEARKPGRRTVVDDREADALVARLAAREDAPQGATASLQARTTAKRQAPVEAPHGAGERAVTRKRGAWTKETPYTRKDGTATRGTTVYMPVELAERLRRYAFTEDTKQNAIMVAAIAAYLERAGA